MAAGRDIKRDTLRIREEQRERNRIANAERDARVAKAEKQAGRTAADRHVHRARPARRGTRTIRDGHRITTVEGESLGGVAFASPAAALRAKAAELGWSDLSGRTPSGAKGYTAKDVGKAVKEKKDREKKAREGVEDKMDRGSGVTIEDKAAP